ncbi:dnaJ homolog subfamily C member 16 [Hoplias malabaricus]|uniref:dnaJ homolog subfamily C member 16 n=1 Tax=Hoplias malabaricus TaxID=27720 RepID=UPI003461DB78
MGALLKTWLRQIFWLAALLVLLDYAVSSSEFNPYKILGVSRHTSQAEIKKAYKQLAREWHPDKNRNPGAEDMFIKISKSYEILSNEERRANYDRFGQTDENQHHGQAPQGFRHFHDNFYFDQSFFHFTQSTRDFTDSKHLLHYEHYMNKVLPDSFKRPYLIKITSEWCFTCIHIEPIWKETVQDLELLGVGIGVVDIGYEKRLANHLGAHRTPSILGLINGKVTFFHYAISREYLRQFVESLLPQKMVQKVTDDNYLQFLNGWREENKPSVLLFDTVPTVPLLYKLTAFAYQDFVRFGYVDQGLTETARILQQFNINTYAPTMMLFKENTEKPADVIQSRGMKKQIIDEFVSNNRFLLVPRLVNQKLFDELCPVKQFHRRRKLKIITRITILWLLKAKYSYIYLFPTRSQTLRYSFLNVAKHSQWMDTLLALTPCARSSDEEEEEDVSSSKQDYTGCVLALNGHKKYFCLFRPVFTGDEPENRSSDEDGGGSQTKSRSSSQQRTSNLEIHHKLDRLSLWMERLMEGTLPRHYVPAWPDLDTITPQK